MSKKPKLMARPSTIRKALETERAKDFKEFSNLTEMRQYTNMSRGVALRLKNKPIATLEALLAEHQQPGVPSGAPDPTNQPSA